MSRALDALVATHVMKWRRSDDASAIGMAMLEGDPLWTITDHGQLIVARRKDAGPWHPSTDMNAALGALETLGGTAVAHITPGKMEAHIAVYVHDETPARRGIGRHANPATALCLALLRAAGVDEDEITRAMEDGS